jgi:hypothetical protein
MVWIEVGNVGGWKQTNNSSSSPVFRKAQKTAIIAIQSSNYCYSITIGRNKIFLKDLCLQIYYSLFHFKAQNKVFEIFFLKSIA